MSKLETLKPGKYYHIYNRGNNGDKIFYQERNYAYFLQKYDHYLSDFVETFAFCLMPNHFHLLIRILQIPSLEGMESVVSKQFRKFFISYSQAINKQQERHGSLFEKNFRRKEVTNFKYLSNLVYYIHNNPFHHGIVDDMADWQFSTYNMITNDKQTKLMKKDVLSWFDGSKESYRKYHDQVVDLKPIDDLILE